VATEADSILSDTVHPSLGALGEKSHAGNSISFLITSGNNRLPSFFFHSYVTRYIVSTEDHVGFALEHGEEKEFRKLNKRQFCLFCHAHTCKEGSVNSIQRIKFNFLEKSSIVWKNIKQPTHAAYLKGSIFKCYILNTVI